MKSTKRLLISLSVPLSLLVMMIGLIFMIQGCVTTAPGSPTKHEVVITVQAIDQDKVEIVEEKADKNKINRTMQVKDDNISLTDFTVLISPEEALISIWGGLTTYDAKAIFNDLQYIQRKTDIKRVIIMINSPGGNAFQGLSIADEILRARKSGIEIAGIASGIVASAAVPIFAVCSTRSASSGTIFLVHEASLWKWPGRETASDIKSQGQLMDLLQHKYRMYLVNHSKVDENTWKKMERSSTWFTAEEALEWGLVDKIE